MLFVKFFLVNKTYECEAFVDLTEVEYKFLVRSARMIKFDDTWGFFIEFECARLLVDPVDAADIDKDVNELWADLVVLHLHWVAVGRDVDLRDHIKQEGLLDLGISYQVVDHSRDESNLWKQLLDHLRQCFVYGVIIYGSEVERQWHLKLAITQ